MPCTIGFRRTISIRGPITAGHTAKTRQVIKTGCCVPGFSSPDDEEGRRFLDPAMGTTDNGSCV
jgi:hypothetical protein